MHSFGGSDKGDKRDQGDKGDKESLRVGDGAETKRKFPISSLELYK